MESGLLEVAPLMDEQELNRCEFVIQKGKQAFIEVGTALQKIRDGKGYRFDYATFEEYVEKRWLMSVRSGYNMISAAHVVENVQPVAQIDYTKAVALSRLNPDEQRKFSQTHNIEEMTKREVEAAIKAQKDAERQAEEAKREAERAKRELASTKEQAQSLFERDRQLREENERLKREKNPEPIVQVETKIVPPDDYEKNKRLVSDLKAELKQKDEQILAHTREEVSRANRFQVRDSIHDLSRAVGSFLNKVKLNVKEHEDDIISDSDLFKTATGTADILRNAADYLDSLVKADSTSSKGAVWDAEYVDVT